MTTSGSKKNKMATAKIEIQGFKTAVHKPMGDITDATSIIYTMIPMPGVNWRTCDKILQDTR